MSDDSLSQSARLVLISLVECPERDTARAIETGPFDIDQVDAQEIEAGLAELAALDPPRVTQRPGGGWQLART